MKKILFLFVAPALFAATPQYQSEKITVPAASADEAIAKQFSLEKANHYLEQGAVAWTRKRGCVTCHTTGTYMQIRPELTPLPTRELMLSLGALTTAFGATTVTAMATVTT